jgi:hypothetical protein
MRRLCFPSVFLLTSLFATAQPALVDSPGLGFAWDARSLTVRALRGIPGAAVLRDALDIGMPLASASISPLHDRALLISSDDGQVRLIRFGAAGAPQLIDGADPSPARIVFAPSGRTALLIGSEVQLATGLDGSPRARSVDLPPLDGSLAMAAVADDAQTMLLSSGAGISAPVWLIAADGGAIRLSLPGTIIVVAFRRNSADAVAATQSGDVYLMRNAGPNGDIQQIYTGDDATSDPVAVQLAPDGSHAYIANTRGTITSIDLRTGSAAAVSCQCQPSALEPLKSNAVFRLTDISNRSIMLFDASSSDPRIWFVPADAASTDAQRSGQ